MKQGEYTATFSDKRMSKQKMISGSGTLQNHDIILGRCFMLALSVFKDELLRI